MYTPVRRSKHCTATLSTLYTAAAAGANKATPSDMDFIHGDNCASLVAEAAGPFIMFDIVMAMA